MKKPINKIYSKLLILSLCSVSGFSLARNVNALPRDNLGNYVVDFTIPSEVKLVFDESGEFQDPNFTITNNSLLPMSLRSINVNAINGWSLVKKEDKDFIRTNDKKVSISIGDIELKKGDNSIGETIEQESAKKFDLSVIKGVWTHGIREKAFEFSFDYEIHNKEFDIVFDVDGGDSLGNLVATNGDQVELPEPVRDGWTFTHWIDQYGVVYYAGDLVTMPVGGLNLTAQWIENAATLMNGSLFNQTINSLKASTETTITSIVFTNEAIPSDKLEGARVVAEVGSNFNAYAYVDGDVIKVSPEKDGYKIYANSDCNSMFSNQSSLTSIVFDNFDTSKVVSMHSMFLRCSRLLELDLSGFDTSNVTSMHNMFALCSSISELDLSKFNTYNVISMGSMFESCSKLSNLNLSSFETPKLTSMSMMFYDCSSLNELDLSKFDTSNVITMWRLFSGCNLLSSLDISNFNTSKVNSMSFMFTNCVSLIELDVSNFDTSKVTNMGGMFSGCSNLTELDVSNFNTEKVTDMNNMFDNCSSLESLDVSSFNVSNVTNMNSIFNGCKSLVELNLSNFDTSSVTGMSGMFQNCSSLTSLDLSRFDTVNVNNISSMFNGCSSLIELNISNFNTSRVNNLSSMFSGCSKLTSLDLSSWNTSSVVNMAGIFNGCSSLNSLDLSNFDFSKVTTMQNMFYGCSGLYSLDVSNFNTISLTNMQGMFTGCRSLVELVGVDKFNASNVTNMYAVFENCRSLANLDLSSWDVGKVSVVATMFKNCSSLSALSLPDFSESPITESYQMFNTCTNLSVIHNIEKFNTRDMKNMTSMFSNCVALTGEITVSNPNITSYGSAFINSATASNSRFIVKYIDDATKEMAQKLVYTKSTNSNVQLWEPEGNLVNGPSFNKLLPGDVTSVTFTTEPIPSDKIEDAVLVSTSDSFEEVYLWREEVSTGFFSKVVGRLASFFTGSDPSTTYYVSPKNEGITIYANENSGQMFFGKSNLVSIVFDNFNTSRSTNIGGMFSWCNSLISLDLSTFDVSKVTNTSAMFNSCHKLESLNLSNWYTSSLENVGSMFFDCISLTSLDLSSWDTTNLTTVTTMFKGCSSLIYIVGLDEFNTSKVTNMSQMFQGCSSLTELNISNWNTSNVTNMSFMFNGCKSLLELNISNFDTSKLTSMQEMFRGCSSLGSLDVSSFDTSNVKNMQAMFRECNSLIELDLSNFNVEKVTNMSSMFNSSSKLTTINISGWNTVSLKDMSYMFRLSSSLSNVVGIEDLITDNVTNMPYLFTGTSLESLDLSKWNTGNVTNMTSMFMDCKLLTSLNVSTFDTASATNMKEIFRNCSSLTELDISNFDLSNATNISAMFMNCSKLSSLDVSNWDVSKVNDMSSVFYGCKSLESIDISKWNTSNVTSTQGLFGDCSSLTSLDISNFDTSKVQNMGGMFLGITLNKIGGLENLDTSSLIYIQQMFSGCTNLSGEITLKSATIHNSGYYAMFANTATAPNSRFVVKYVDDATKSMAQTLVNTKSSNSNVFLHEYEGTLITGTEFNKLVPSDATSITFTEEAIPSDKLDEAILVSTGDSFEEVYLWKADVPSGFFAKMFGKIKTLVTDDSNPYFVSPKNDGVMIYANENLSNMFFGKSNLVSVGFENLDMSKAINVTNMFYGCNKLSSLDVSNWDVSNVTSFGSMFVNCTSLKQLDMSNWSNSNYINVNSMFGFTGLVEVDISWMLNPTTFYRLFYGSSSLSNVIGLENVNTSNVIDMQGMFYNCKSLTSLDLSNFDSSKVTNMSGMFSGCSSLESIDLSSFNTSKVTNMNQMFWNCSSLTSLDVSSFNTKNVTNMSYMFSGCSKLSSLDLDSFNTSKVTDMSGMFNGCSSLTELDLSNFDTSRVTTMNSIFRSSINLKSIEGLKDFNTSSLVDISYAFYWCNSLSGEITIMNPNMTNWSGCAYAMSTLARSKFLVKYVDSAKSIAESIISTRAGNSNVYLFEAYSISYELDGGTNPSDAPTSYNIQSEKITLPTPSKAGYNFLGWFDNKSFTGNAITEIPSGSVGNKTFYAKWIPVTYIVRFDGNEATSGSMDNMIASYGENNKLTQNSFTKTGHKFKNWNIKKEINGEIYWLYILPNKGFNWYREGTEPEGYVKHVYSDGAYIIGPTNIQDDIVTLVAQWEINKLYIHYQSNGAYLDEIHGSGIALDSEGFVTVNGSRNIHTCSYGQGLLSDSGLRDYNYGPGINLKRTGYYATDAESFNTKPDGTGISYSQHKDYVVSDLADLSNGDVTLVLYVNWKPITYSIKYDGNGSTGGSTVSSVHSYDSSSTLTLNSFTKAGYSFAGWNTSPFDTGVSYNDGESINNLTSENGKTVTLYAQWKANEYSTTVNNGLGTSILTNSFLRSMTLNTPTKEGYTFAGWEHDPSLGVFGYGNFADPYFNTSGLSAYAGSGGSVEKVSASSDNPVNGYYEYVINCIGKDSSNRYTGFHNVVKIKENNVYYIHSFIAKLPKGTRLKPYMNQQESNNIEWLTPSYGTGEWQLYSYKYHCTNVQLNIPYPSDVGHVAVFTENSSVAPFTWRVAYNQIFKLTDDTSNISSISYLNMGSDTLTAQWTPNSDTKYIVNHYQMNPDGSTYSLVESETKQGVTDSELTTSSLAKTYEGFTYSSSKVGESVVTSTTLNADGSLIVDLYYSRNQYWFDLNGLINNVFIGSLDNTAYANIYINGEMVRNLAGDYYRKHYYGSTFKVEVITNAGYEYCGLHEKNYTNSDNIWMESTNTLEGVITKNTVIIPIINAIQYTITYNLNGGTNPSDAITSYTVDGATLPTPTRTNYKFLGWKDDITGSVITSIPSGTTGDKSYTAQWALMTHEATLMSGPSFNSAVSSLVGQATSLKFTKEAIPSNKIATAILVSDSTSETNVYAYLGGDTIYVSPETSGSVIYANIDCTNMFKGFTSLVNISFENFNTSNVTNMSSMFRDCKSLISVDVSSFDTSNVTDMSYMFRECNSILNLDLSNFNTSKVTTVLDIFARCFKVQTINLTNWDTSKVTNMRGFFSECDIVTKIYGLENLDTSSVTNMYYIFNECYKLTGEFTIRTGLVTNTINTYGNALSYTSTNPGCSLTLNYVDDASKAVLDLLLTTRTVDSNIVVGTKVP